MMMCSKFRFSSWLLVLSLLTNVTLLEMSEKQCRRGKFYLGTFPAFVFVSYVP